MRACWKKNWLHYRWGCRACGGCILKFDIKWNPFFFVLSLFCGIGWGHPQKRILSGGAEVRSASDLRAWNQTLIWCNNDTITSGCKLLLTCHAWDLRQPCLIRVIRYESKIKFSSRIPYYCNQNGRKSTNTEPSRGQQTSYDIHLWRWEVFYVGKAFMALWFVTHHTCTCLCVAKHVVMEDRGSEFAQRGIKRNIPGWINIQAKFDEVILFKVSLWK